MAKLFLTSIDLNLNELRRGLLHLLGAAPAGPVEGQLYHDTALHKSRFYDGASWKNMDGSSLSPDQLVPMAGDLNANNHKITALTDPTGAQDAANKRYVDAAINGVEWKAPVKAIAIANIAALTGLPIIDGYQTVAGDRVLLTGQAAPAQNGPWVIAAGAWARPADFASGSAQQNAAIFVDGGATLANTGWVISGQAAVNVDATAQTWVKFTGLGEVNVTLPLTKVGDTISAPGVPTKFAATIGDGASTAIAVAHNLGTRDVVVEVYDAASFAQVFCDVVMTNVNTVTLTFSVAPAVGAYRVVVIG